MFSENDKISLRQLQMLLLLNIFGTAVITLPRVTAEAVGRDGWLLVAGGGIVMAFYAVLLNCLAGLYPGCTFVELSQKILGRPLGILLSLGFALKILITTGLHLRVFCEIVRETLLFRTPIYITAGAMLLTAAYACVRGYECRARVAEILVPVIFIPLLLIFLFAAFNTDYSNLRPAFHTAPVKFLQGSIMTAFAFQGLEFILLAHPYLKGSKGAGKASATAVLALTAVMTAATAITIARFGPEDVKVKLWPVLQLMDTVDLPGSFIERQDAFMMWFWILSAFGSVSAGLFLVSLISARLRGRKQWGWLLTLLALPLILIVAMYPKDIAQTYSLLDKESQLLGTIYLFAAPILLLGVSAIERHWKRGSIQ